MSVTKDQVKATLALLCERFPKCFVMYERKRRPLKIGTHHDVIVALGKMVEEKILGKAIKRYVKNDFYLKALRAGALRFDLDGNPAGVVADEESQNPPAKRKPKLKPAAAKPKDGLAALREAARKRKARCEGVAS